MAGVRDARQGRILPRRPRAEPLGIVTGRERADPQRTHLERLARLEDVEAIKHLIARYAQLCDSGYAPEPGARARAAEAVAALFVEDAAWESDVFGNHAGREGVRALVAGIGDQVNWTRHYLLNPTVEVAPGEKRATGTWYLPEPATMTGESELEAVVLSAVYQCAFREEHSEWRIERMHAEFHQVSSLSEGWVELADGVTAGYGVTAIPSCEIACPHARQFVSGMFVSAR